MQLLNSVRLSRKWNIMNNAYNPEAWGGGGGGGATI